MRELTTITPRLPTTDEIANAATEHLPAMRATIEQALAMRPAPAEGEDFYFELVGRVPKCSTEMAAEGVQEVQTRLILERAANFPPVVLREVLDRAETEWEWRPTAKEVLDFATKLERQHRRLLSVIDKETERRAVQAELQAQHDAMIAEMVQQAREHFGMDETTLLDAWAMAEKHLYNRTGEIRRALRSGTTWCCEMLTILAEVKRRWPTRAAQQADKRVRGILCVDSDFVYGQLSHQIRQAFCHLRDGKSIDAESKERNPIAEVYRILEGDETDGWPGV